MAPLCYGNTRSLRAENPFSYRAFPPTPAAQFVLCLG